MLATTSLTCSLHLLPSSVASEQNQIGPKVTFFLLQEMRYENPRHDFLFTLWLQPKVVWLKETGSTAEPSQEVVSDPQIRMALGRYSREIVFWGARIVDFPVQVLAETWVKQVLPEPGLNSLRLVEVALPTLGGFYPELAPTSYDEARQGYDLGNYRACIEKCRYVRHAIEEHVG